MSSKKDSPKWKAILLAIDTVLLGVALGLGAYCFDLAATINAIPDAALLSENIQAQKDAISDQEIRLQEQTETVAQAEAESLAAFNAASDALAEVQAELDAVTAQHDGVKAQVEDFENATQLQEQLKLDIAAVRTEYGQAIRKLEDMILAGESDYRICYLTFDDGPSYITDQFLDKLDSHDVHVTFFTIGVQMGDSGQKLRNELLRREALAGHSIANHTYTHGIDNGLYSSLDSFIAAVEKQDQLVYETTGMHTDLLRFPAGSYYCPFRKSAIAKLDEMGYGWIDWIGNAFDSGNFGQTSDRVASNVIWQAQQDKVTVVLMHDWRTDTLGALDRIITTLKEENYLFLPLFKESCTVGTAVPKFDD